MADISASMIKELREKSGAGMLDCKKALTESDGNIEAAIDWLRKKGLAAAAKKSGRTAAEGLVSIAVNGNQGAIIELNAETDFVARNEQFQELAKHIAEAALTTGNDIEALKKASYPASDRNIEDEVTHAISTIGENMNLRRATSITAANGFVASYIHNAAAPGLGKIAVLVAVETDSDAPAVQEIAKQVAMHIAAAKPEALTRDDIDAQTLERERQVFKEQAIASGKPAEIAEKMVEGRIRKYYGEIVLLEQPFVIDGKTPVKEAIDAAAKETGANISISDYAMFQLGEGIEKEENDFAAEVAATAGAA